MKHLIPLSFAFATIMALASCSREEEQCATPEPETKAPVFTAAYDQTKTAIDDDRNVTFSNGDVISVNGSLYRTEGTGADGKAEFVIVEGQSAPSSEPGTVYDAFYPSSIVNGGVASFPALQTYEEGKYNIPLHAQSQTTSLGFSHIGGVLKVKVTSATGITSLGSITISSDNCATSGEFIMNGKLAVLKDPTAKTKKTSLVCNGTAIDNTGKWFFISVPAQAYSRLKICVEGTDDDGTAIKKYMATKEGASINVERNTIYPINFRENYVPSSVNLLEGRTISRSSITGMGATGTMQGAAYYGGKIYQMKYDRSATAVRCEVYDIASKSWSTLTDFVWSTNSHVGSATFGQRIFTQADGYEYDCTMPFLYVTGHYDADGTGKKQVIDILDIEHSVSVKKLTLPDLEDDAIAAYDFDEDKVWLLGYPTGNGMAPYILQEYDVDLDNINLTQTDITTANWEMTFGGPDSDGIQKDLICGTVQDIYYKDGYLYYSTGRGGDANRTEWVKVNAFSLADKVVETTMIIPVYEEAQGFVYDDDNDHFYITSFGNNATSLWRLDADITGQADGKYNFEPATATGTDTYSISNGSQLTWFIGQIYAGRTSISAVLANDIDMMGQTDPFTVYVYDKQNPRKYEAQYAFRGLFDGKNHTISNVSINSTPYNNCGVFPYVLGATIKDVTVDGAINMSSDVDNIGFIGYMEGGEVSGVDVSDFTINLGSYSPEHSNQLIGNAVDVTLSGNTLAGDHETYGDVYVNGVCVSTGTCTAKYQTPSQDANETYQISNAGNLIWFANAINDGTIAANSSAVLTADIDLKGSRYGSFPGIGVGTSKAFAGTFDGQGHTIKNFYQDKNAARTGLFNYVSGASNSAKATIKDFTLLGNINLSASQNMHGSVIGEAAGYTLVEDVNSGVMFTSTNASAILGGFSGSLNGANAIMNRCRFYGTISDGAVISQIGGLVGDLRGGQVKNCLFDGTINSSSSSASLNVGGLIGNSSTGSGKVQYCLSHGTINLQAIASELCGHIIGTASTTVAFTSTYYAAGTATSIHAAGKCSAAPTGDTLSTEGLSNTMLRFYLGEVDWNDGTDYPIPYRFGQGVHTHIFDDEGFCIANDGGSQEPLLNDGNYEIDNAAKLIWFANKSKTDASINAVLTSDINLKDRAFPGIATNGTRYTGTFDGRGHKISGYAYSNNSGTSGFIISASGATIKSFTLEGTMTLSHTSSTAFHGAILGLGENNTTIEDVTSNVTITCTTDKLRLVGGIAGRVTGTVNRCRFTGTINLGQSYDQAAGICASARGGLTISNCLFDGTIISSYSGTSELKVGGIISAHDNGNITLTKCLSHGTITLANPTVTQSIGIVYSNINTNNTLTVSDMFYTTEGATLNGEAFTQVGGAAKSGATFTQKTADMSWNDVLNTLGTTNWKLDSSSGYPVPQNN